MKFRVLLTGLMLMYGAGDALAWPTRAVRVIATSPPGGAVDLLARVAADEFSTAFGQPFVVENRPGANGNLGVELVLKALIFGLSLGALAGAAFAGEDSTHRYHCTGVTYYDHPGGPMTFDQSMTECGATVQTG